MAQYKIAVVNSSSFGQVFKEHWQQIEEIGEVKRFMLPTDIDGKSLAKELNGYNIIIASVTPMFNKEFFDNKDETLLISRHGIGFNNVDIKAAKEHGTKVAIVPQLVERDSVAENELANLMTLVRRTVQSAERERDDRYEDRAEFMGNELSGKTFGVIGCGNIGSRVAELFSVFGGPILVNDPDPKAPAGWLKSHNVERVDLDTLLEKADYISLNASLNDGNYHLIDAKKIAKMKKGVYLCNNARGALIDETALLDGIKSGKVAGYAADAVEVEPVRATSPLLQNDRVLLTPHTSAYTYECLHGMGEKCVSDVKNIVANKPLVRELTSTLA
ncbi:MULTISPECIES: D-isomer specific 2-hydroxyacid dehydrogenase family protein [Levilactobacillus]|uniref:2-hydroxyacid dehydrogenase n=2 Tax=Levilactobacillus TaxID=2767886 RepID=A0A0R1GZJ3_9LACO|nr:MULTISPECIES: D-isomer specific 2-hydroxyacid dehydrogenase family protein [Levilactobacillus]KRK36546.1 2-hydroxyacid dehydrogenase [Levilactobacillus parabrevis ATCC 53295]KRL94422.1 2-hydroxyacid dehydrogenase [Levilactobacillus hammesii DSM 16381]KRO05906.1 2-hydroxyacid dehydrogenase [Levilactobacillus parabrevis]